MVALSLLDKALLQLRMQRKLELGVSFQEAPMFSSCAAMQPRHMSPSAVAAAAQQQSPSPLGPLAVHWAPTLEQLDNGKHVPWAVTQPSKPILKVRDYDMAEMAAQTGHWSQHPEALGGPIPLRIISKPEFLQETGDAAATFQPRRSLNRPHCVKILSQKRNRNVAFAL